MKIPTPKAGIEVTKQWTKDYSASVVGAFLFAHRKFDVGADGCCFIFVLGNGCGDGTQSGVAFMALGSPQTKMHNAKTTAVMLAHATRAGAAKTAASSVISGGSNTTIQKLHSVNKQIVF